MKKISVIAIMLLIGGLTTGCENENSYKESDIIGEWVCVKYEDQNPYSSSAGVWIYDVTENYLRTAFQKDGTVVYYYNYYYSENGSVISEKWNLDKEKGYLNFIGNNHQQRSYKIESLNSKTMKISHGGGCYINTYMKI